MTDAADDLPLAAEFPPATDAQWRKLVDGVLKGAPFETLQSKSRRRPHHRAALSARA